MTKDKKAGQRQIRSSRRSQPSFLAARRRAIWALVVAVTVCAATAGFFSLRFLLCTDEKLQRTKQPSNQTEGAVLLPVDEAVRTEQEIAALKKEELELAEKLTREFRGSENSLMIMGNVLNRHGNAIEALEFYERVLKINPKRADVYTVMGQFSLNEGKLADAIGHWRKALNIQPQLRRAHSNIGHALMILGRQNESMEELEKEIRISPNSSLAWFLLGQIYLMQKEYEKAKENYEAAIKVNPAYTNAYYGLATVSAKLGDSDKAKEYSEKFKKLKAEERKDLKGRKILYDDIDQTKKNTALTYIEAGQMYRDAGKFDKAEELLKQAAGLDPENAVCFSELASLYQKNGQPAKAIQMYKKISEVEPENPICYAGIAMLSVQLQRFGDAEKAFRKVIKLAPKSSNGYRNLAHLYLRSNSRLAEARQLAEKAVAVEAIAPNYFVLSLACDRNGDTAGAFSAIKRAVELEPGNPQYQRLYRLIQQRI